MATSTEKKSRLSKDHSSDGIKDTDSNAFLAEERRLLKPPVIHPVSEKRISKFNTRVNQMTPKQIDEELQKRRLSINGEMDIRRVRLKQHYKLELTYERANSLEISEQEFEYLAVIDFEATCEKNQEKDYQNEIIEFPIVLINVQKQKIVDKFQSYCRPIHKPILSKFCTELTSIEQHQVDSAPTFVEVLHNVEVWLNERNLLSSTNQRRLAFATDGPWDFANFLRVQCHLSSIPYPRWAEKWINIRKDFASFYVVQRCGVNNMLGKLGLTFDGRPHSGLDDAINIARIAIELIKDGRVLLLNDEICASDPKFVARTEEKVEISDKEEEEEEDSVVFED